MTNTIVSFEAAPFISTTRRRSYSYVGAEMILRAHLTLAQDNRLSRAAIHALFNTRSAQAAALIDEVMDFAFREDDKGMVYSPAIDRAASTLSDRSFWAAHGLQM